MTDDVSRETDQDSAVPLGDTTEQRQPTEAQLRAGAQGLDLHVAESINYQRAHLDYAPITEPEGE